MGTFFLRNKWGLNILEKWKDEIME